MVYPGSPALDGLEPDLPHSSCSGMKQIEDRFKLKINGLLSASPIYKIIQNTNKEGVPHGIS